LDLRQGRVLCHVLLGKIRTRGKIQGSGKKEVLGGWSYRRQKPRCITNCGYALCHRVADAPPNPSVMGLRQKKGKSNINTIRKVSPHGEKNLAQSEPTCVKGKRPKKKGVLPYIEGLITVSGFRSDGGVFELGVESRYRGTKRWYQNYALKLAIGSLGSAIDALDKEVSRVMGGEARGEGQNTAKNGRNRGKEERNGGGAGEGGWRERRGVELEEEGRRGGE